MIKDSSDRGLIGDVDQIITIRSRREVISAMLCGGVAALAGCTGRETSAGAADASASSRSCIALPSEMRGPYPADGSNQAAGSVSNVLTQVGIVRSNITRSFGASTTTASGVPFTLAITLVNANDGCTPLNGYAVYLWHCTDDGQYSLYADGMEEENYLRGVQVSDSQGNLGFETIFAGCYPGRDPHLHFEVYPSLQRATRHQERIFNSQLALPRDIAAQVYRSSKGYASSARQLGLMSWLPDLVFINNSKAELARMTPTLTGSIDAGYAGRIVIAIPA